MSLIIPRVKKSCAKMTSSVQHGYGQQQFVAAAATVAAVAAAGVATIAAAVTAVAADVPP